MDTVKVSLRLRGVKGRKAQCCFELPRGGKQAWVDGACVVSDLSMLDVGKVLEVELDSTVAAAQGWKKLED